MTRHSPENRIRVISGAAALAILALAVAGCGQLERRNYMAVSLGQLHDEVRKVLGAPRFQFGSEWVYTADDPRDLTKISIWFGEDKKVAAKSWQNPERPWENHREGQAGQPQG